jgi:hypothetical protein
VITTCGTYLTNHSYSFLNYVSDCRICEQCIESLSPNVVNFLCQAFGTIIWVHAKFQDFLTIFIIYFILFKMTSEFKCEILYTNNWNFEQYYGIGAYLGRGSKIYFLYNFLNHIWGRYSSKLNFYLKVYRNSFKS